MYYLEVYSNTKNYILGFFKIRNGMNSPLRWSISLSFTRRYVPETGHENYQPLGNICRVTSETFFFLWWYIADLNWKTFSKGFRKNTKFQELYLAHNCTCITYSSNSHASKTLFFEEAREKYFFNPITLSIETLLFTSLCNCWGPVEEIFMTLYLTILLQVYS